MSIPDVERSLIERINTQRNSAGIQTLTASETMSRLALDHSVLMGSRDDLVSKGDTQLDECYKKEGRTYWEGYAQSYVQTWLYSSTTYVNGIPVRQWMTQDQLTDDIFGIWAEYFEDATLLNPRYDRVGVGIETTPDDKVYVMLNYC